MWFEDYQWHYDYVRLAWDTGFAFEKCKSPNLDKNKICVVDVDKIVRDRDVGSVDRHIATVVQYILDDEQAKVLDINFVKIFRISQLAVEYLLFCKKYLDNTVVLLKKELTRNREENKELKAFVDDLQDHVATLTRQQAVPTFKCTSCAKLFSSEEYLNAHTKRRHSNQTTETYHSDTDKLNMEIKELKERLNNTEKLLKEKEALSHKQQEEPDNDKDARIVELLGKFDKFREQVNGELKELRMQKTFYEENYGKLFDMVISNKENVEPKTGTTETTTQTDKVLHMETVQNRNVLEIQEDAATSSNEESKENIEAKITNALEGIEGRMQAFWDKLQHIEANSEERRHHKEADDVEVKPKIKPRTKFSQPTVNTRRGNSENIEKIRAAIEHEEKKLKKNKQELLEVTEEVGDVEVKAKTTRETRQEESLPKVTEVKVVKNLLKPKEELLEDVESEETDDDESQSDSSVSDDDEEIIRPSSASLKKISSVKREDMEARVIGRLRELGISESWTGLPQKSFERALEIVNHQATLTYKRHPKFEAIKKRIDSEVTKQCKKQESSETYHRKIVAVPNVVKISYRPKSGRGSERKVSVKPSPTRQTVDIKNRAIFESDSDSDHPQPSRTYTKVVSELKQTQKRNFGVSETPDSMKRFSSVSSLSKKKVNFDLDSDSSKVDDLPVVQRALGGSTTSVASSILKDRGESDNERKKDKVKAEDDELSDLSLSDV